MTTNLSPFITRLTGLAIVKPVSTRQKYHFPISIGYRVKHAMLNLLAFSV